MLLTKLTDHDLMVARAAVWRVAADQEPPPSGLARYRLLAWTVAAARGALQPLPKPTAEKVGKRLEAQAKEVAGEGAFWSKATARRLLAALDSDSDSELPDASNNGGAAAANPPPRADGPKPPQRKVHTDKCPKCGKGYNPTFVDMDAHGTCFKEGTGPNDLCHMHKKIGEYSKARHLNCRCLRQNPELKRELGKVLNFGGQAQQGKKPKKTPARRPTKPECQATACHAVPSPSATLGCRASSAFAVLARRDPGIPASEPRSAPVRSRQARQRMCRA
jgi:hypothetical protein